MSTPCKNLKDVPARLKEHRHRNEQGPEYFLYLLILSERFNDCIRISLRSLSP
jgi:hypothetical protein